MASLDSRSSRSDENATLIIVQAKLTVDLCYLLRINYAESPAGTSRRCEFDFAGRANSSYHNERIYYMVYVIEGCSSESIIAKNTLNFALIVRAIIINARFSPTWRRKSTVKTVKI